MRLTEIAHGVHQLSVNVENILFEGLWEMPKGVSINSYVVKGDEVALIDGVCGWDGVPESLFELLDQLNVPIKSIKYVVLNHLEPDHAGFLDAFKQIHSDFEVICTAKGAELLTAFYDAHLKVRIVKDDDMLNLGGGKVLTFKEIPHVHWPDAMVSFESQTGVLFSCDAFGSFGIMEKSAFDDDYTDAEIEAYEKETIRYYSNIIGAFSPFVPKAVNQINRLAVRMIAPGHGLIWRKRKDKIVADYLDYACYQKGIARPEITLLWGSMYNNTGAAVQVAIETLEASGITYHVHQVPETPWGELLTSVWTSSALILAMPTYEYKMFPPMAAALEEIGKKKAHGRKVFRMGSYGWSGGAQKELDEIHDRLRLNWSFLPPHEFKGKPLEADFEIIRERVLELIESVKSENSKK